MAYQPNGDVSYFARANSRNDERLFGIKQADRLSHLYLIGEAALDRARAAAALGRAAQALDEHAGQLGGDHRAAQIGRASCRERV